MTQGVVFCYFSAFMRYQPFGCCFGDLSAMEFSFVAACLQKWKSSPELQRKAIKREPLAISHDQKAIVFPSLPNLKLNYYLLKGFTSHMADSGFIVTKSVHLIRAAIEKFYVEQDPVMTDKVSALACGSADSVKKMLSAIKRKWSRWEIPKEPCDFCSDCFR